MIQIPNTVVVDVRRVLDEDVRNGDKTVDLIPADADGQESLITRDPVVIAEIPNVEEVFRQLDPKVNIDRLVNKDDHIKANSELATFTVPARAPLTGERAALNFTQMLSAVASRTGRLVQLVSIKFHLVH